MYEDSNELLPKPWNWKNTRLMLR